MKYTETNADDLNDELEYQVDTSSNESENEDQADISSHENDTTRESSSTSSETKRNKRKRQREKLKEKKKKKFGSSDQQSGSLIHSPDILSDIVNNQIRLNFKDLSAVELQDRFIKASYIQDTLDFSKERKTENYTDFLLHAFENPNQENVFKKVDANGSPTTLIFCLSALRALDIVKALRKLQTNEFKIAKLFGKHIKLDEHNDYCKKNKIGIAVGTPQRILQLTNGSLNLQNLKFVVLDYTFTDKKSYNIITNNDCKKPVMEFLTHPVLLQRLTDKQTKICFY
ncbi:replication regulator [Schizosaccharomyces cryophilus OY26]|uniref:Replication regulator n=1 Tax=Schizosaccharomyces cryophilus (strain OY26 / ATCC MYA-4695 / CBS 11777 / NBRC 106824 / NRRL Y48691) TaxID=653667 RepID=S9VU24_SCHCR|nr:replication regulator [Schizosaccharomyces cryophilus OY26]EPY49605.1 replication regulator [Schizosaccharomyces cryophilus OY26]